MIDRKRNQNVINVETVEMEGTRRPPLYEPVPTRETIEILESVYSTLHEPTRSEEDGERRAETLPATNYLGIGTEIFTSATEIFKEEQIERLTWEIQNLEAKNDYLRTQVSQLQDLHGLIQSEKLGDISDALVDKPAVFILDAFFHRNSIRLSDIEQNIDSATGWMMLARLLKAGLIYEKGEELHITDTGREFYKKIEGLITSSGE